MKQVYPLLLLLIWLTSCSVADQIDRLQTPDWQPEIAVALAQTTISLEDALALTDTLDFLDIGTNGELTLQHEMPLFEGIQADILTIPDLSIPMVQHTLSAPFLIADLDELALNSGSISFAFQPQEAVVDYTLLLSCPGLSMNGQPLKETFQFSGNDPQVVTLDLRDYLFTFINGEVTLAYQVTNQATSQSVNVGVPVWTFENMAHRYASGYFGQRDISPPSDSFDIDLGINVDDLRVRFEDPRLHIVVNNKVGIPMLIQAESMAFKSNSGQVYPLISNYLEAGVTLNYPENRTVVEPSQTTITLDKDNSNLVEVLQEIPHHISWDFRALTHPQGARGPRGFLTDDADIDANVRLELPLTLSIEELRFTSVQEVELPDLDFIEEAGARIIIDNGFPLDADLQVYFQDEAGVRIDSIFEEGSTRLLAGAAVDDNGNVSGTTERMIDVALSAAQLARLAQTQRLEFVSRLRTTGATQQPVQLTAQQGLGLKVGLTARR